MTQNPETLCTAFHGTAILLGGPLAQVAPIALATDGALVLDDATGRVIDLDPRDWSGAPRAQRPDEPPKRRGRPKLGVTPREVTLLPRHWDWLATQQGGASATLRRLVDAARKTDGGRGQARQATYRAMHALAGDLPGFEDASRALFAANDSGFAAQIQDWPPDLRAFLVRLSNGPAT